MKQADTVMLGYPLGFKMPREVRKNDLEVYEPVTDPDGPAMTWVRANQLRKRSTLFLHFSPRTTCRLLSGYVSLDFFLCLVQSMFAIGWLELGEAEKAQLLLQKCFQNIQGPFQVSLCLPP